MAALALFLALLLVVSAGHKLVERQRLASVAARLAGAPAQLGPALLLAAAAYEATAALALTVAPLRPGGAFAAAALWSGYTLALLRHRGERLDCGCDFVRREKPVGAFAIMRPALLASMALSVAAVPSAAWTLDAPFAALALLALWFAASELFALPARERIRP